MSSDNKLLYSLFGIGAIAAAAAGIYYLAQDEEEIMVKYDAKIHTREALLELLLEFELEYASLYLHWYHMLKQKEKEVGKGKIPEDIMTAVQEQVKKLAEDTEEEVLENFKYSKSFFNEWLAKYEKDKKIINLYKSFETNFQKLMKIEKPLFNFTYPKEITKQSYIKFIKVAYAKFRYDIYNEIQTYLRASGKTKISEEEFNYFIKK